MKPKKPKKEDYKSNIDYREALRKYKSKLHLWNLNNNPEQLENESEELYDLRTKMFERERKKRLNPQSKLWENLKEKQTSK